MTIGYLRLRRLVFKHYTPFSTSAKETLRRKKRGKNAKELSHFLRKYKCGVALNCLVISLISHHKGDLVAL